MNWLEIVGLYCIISYIIIGIVSLLTGLISYKNKFNSVFDFILWLVCSLPILYMMLCKNIGMLLRRLVVGKDE